MITVTVTAYWDTEIEQSHHFCYHHRLCVFLRGQVKTSAVKKIISWAIIGHHLTFPVHPTSKWAWKCVCLKLIFNVWIRCFILSLLFSLLEYSLPNGSSLVCNNINNNDNNLDWSQMWKCAICFPDWLKIHLSDGCKKASMYLNLIRLIVSQNRWKIMTDTVASQKTSFLFLALIIKKGSANEKGVLLYSGCLCQRYAALSLRNSFNPPVKHDCGD